MTQVCFSPDGTLIATACRTSVPCLWDAASGRPIGSVGTRRHAGMAVRFNADGTLAAAACDDGDGLALGNQHR